MVPVAAAILIDGQGRVLLTQRPRWGTNACKWEFPGGKLMAGETPEECLRRELREELSIQVEVGDVFHVVSHSVAGRSILLMAYLCRFQGGQISLSEHMASRWVEIAELKDFDLADADRPIAEKLCRCPLVEPCQRAQKAEGPAPDVAAQKGKEVPLEHVDQGAKRFRVHKEQSQ